MLKKLALTVALLVTTSAYAAVPQGTKYEGWCAYGLTKGMKVATDCSINWKGTDGSTYCFSTEANKGEWAKDTTTNMAKADAGYAQLTANAQTNAALNQAASAVAKAQQDTNAALEASNLAIKNAQATAK